MKLPTPSSTDRKSFFASPAVHLTLIALAGLAVYANTFNVPFVFDDFSAIVENPVIKDLDRFLSGEGYRYNPRRFVAYLSFALNYRFGGLDLAGFHLVNLLVHMANGFLVYALIRLCFRTPFLRGCELAPRAGWIALAAALLFTVHPVQTQAVTYVVQRVAALATMFYLLSVVLYAGARILQEDLSPVDDWLKRRICVVLLSLGALLAAVAAMHTKEIAFTLPFVVLLYEFSFFRTSLKTKLLLLLPILATALIIPLSLLGSEKPLGEILSDVDRMSRETEQISRHDYLVTQFRVIVTYLRLLVLPVNQNLDYDYPVYDSFLQPQVFLSFLVLAGLLGMAAHLYGFRFRFPGFRKASSAAACNSSRLIGFGILWFFIALSVESSVIPIRDLIFEHRLYLPSAGALLALGTSGTILLRRLPTKVSAATVLVIVLALGAGSWNRNQAWGNPVTLWRDSVAKSPAKARPHHNLGLALRKEGRLREAIEEYRLALQRSPESSLAYTNLGVALEEYGFHQEAWEAYQTALNLDSENPDARNNLGSFLGKMGENEEAVSHLGKAVQLNPKFADAYFNLGLAFRRMGKTDLALSHYLKTIQLDPDHSEAHNNLGVVYWQMGQGEKAVEHFRTAVALNPDKIGYRQNLSQITEKMW